MPPDVWRINFSLLFACMSATLMQAAPDEAALGRERGYPRGTPATVWQEEYRVGSFSAMDRIFSHGIVAPAAQPRELKTVAREPIFFYLLDGQTLTVADYLNRQRVTGLLVLKDGVIVKERYQYGRKATDRLLSNSMSKTLTALAVGAALGEGKIESLDDPPAKYVPELAGCAYGETPIKYLLQMSSGVKFTEVYDGKDDVALWSRLSQTQGTIAAARHFNEREAAPGKRFHYASSETAVLALTVRGATGRTLCQYLSEKIWQPMGAETEATWVTTPDGVELAYGFFNATVRDYARLGWLLANDGQLDGKQIIPRDFLLRATATELQPEAFRPGIMDYKGSTYFGYGYQVWIYPGTARRFVLLGVYGQAIFVDPQLKLVMVHTAVAKEATDTNLGRERAALWRGIVSHYGTW